MESSRGPGHGCTIHAGTARSPETTAIPDGVKAAFERRAARAEALAASSDAAAEPLRFAAGLYRAQGALAARLVELPVSGRLEQDAAPLLERCGPLLKFLSEHGPPLLAGDAHADAGRLLGYWRARGSSVDYLSRALLRPYVEWLARLRLRPDRTLAAHACSFCGGRPWIAIRRATADADAAERLLGCGLCGGEWPVGRITCAGCGEDDPAKLPSFSEPTHPAVRIEACQACSRYVKSIDLTRDARAIPEVDDLVSLGMDLWAAREGFTRLEPGLAGL